MGLAEKVSWVHGARQLGPGERVVQAAGERVGWGTANGQRACETSSEWRLLNRARFYEITNAKRKMTTNRQTMNKDNMLFRPEACAACVR